jgi:hypothetical protein
MKTGASKHPSLCSLEVTVDLSVGQRRGYNRD